MTEEKKLYRSILNNSIAGVCGGLSEYFNIDIVIVRIIFVLATIFGGGGLIVYIVLWIVLPQKPFPIKNPTNNDTTNSDINNSNNMENQFEQQKEKRSKRNYHGNLTGGLILITLGILFLIDKFVPQINFGDLWPVLLIVIGITMLMRNISKKNKENQE